MMATAIQAILPLPVVAAAVTVPACLPGYTKGLIINEIGLKNPGEIPDFL